MTSTRITSPPPRPESSWLPRRAGELQGEARSSTFLRLEPDAAAHGGDEAADEEEAEACALAGGRSLRAEELREDPLLVGLGVPRPSSATVISTACERPRALTVIVPPSGEYRTALSSRLASTCPNFSPSARTVRPTARPGRRSRDGRVLPSPLLPATASRRAAPRSIGSRAVLASSRATLRRSSTIRMSRSDSAAMWRGSCLRARLRKIDVAPLQGLREAVDRRERRPQLVRDRRDGLIGLLDDTLARDVPEGKVRDRAR